MTPIEQAIEALSRCTPYMHKSAPIEKYVAHVTAIAALRAQPDHSELVKRLRHTASKGVSVWGDLMIEAADALEGKV